MTKLHNLKEAIQLLEKSAEPFDRACTILRDMNGQYDANVNNNQSGTPYKWAAEIHAMAYGKEVEGRVPIAHNWRDADEKYNPLTHPNDEWRIKPEKQVLRYQVAKMKGCDMFWLESVYTEDAAKNIQKSAAFVEWLHDWQEVEVE